MNTVMMEINTTEAALCEIETEAASYSGLHVDMDEPEQRKYVKAKAAIINDILKRIERAEIDLPKGYRKLVKDEAAPIKKRLMDANTPFTLLLDEYNKKRKAELDAEKAIKDAEALAIQKDIDHEFALLLDKSHAADKAEAERLHAERDDKIREQAAADAVEAEQVKARNVIIDEAYQDDQRKANVKHCRTINLEILAKLLATGITEKQGKAIITLVVNGLCGNMVINY